MDTALDLAERITVLHYGSVIVEGTRAEVVADPKTREVYLGDTDGDDRALALDGVDALYGDSHVLHGVSFTLQAGRVLALLGRNGAGKTTCMNTIIGFLPPRAGDDPPLRRADRAAVARGDRAQGRRPGAAGPAHLPDADGAGEPGGRAARAPEARSRGRSSACSTLFPRLKERQQQHAGSLSGGEQQMLAIGRALMGNPRVLLMDEPSEGLAPLIVAEVGRTIARLKEEGQSIVLVEQNVKLALELADEVVILNTGRVVFAGGVGGVGEDLITQHLGVH